MRPLRGTRTGGFSAVGELSWSQSLRHGPCARYAIDLYLNRAAVARIGRSEAMRKCT